MAALQLPAEWQPSETSVALYTSFQHEMPVAATKAMREELDWITSPIGVKFAWRNFGETARRNTVARLAVVHFQGQCDAQDLTTVPANPADRWKLGWTHSVDGNILPFADIFCDLIRIYISPTLLSTDPAQRDAIYGRAVGRVLAHELYHVFADTRKHALTGLMKATYSEENLVSDTFGFRSTELRNLRTIIASTLIYSTSAQFPPREGGLVFASNGCIGCHGPQADGTSTGPRIKPSKLPQTVASLRSMLSNSQSEMARRARRLKLSWKDISQADLTKLLTFLKDATDPVAAMTSAPASYKQ
jgi:hypothetical protein